MRLAAIVSLAWAVLLSSSMAQPVAPGDTPGVPWTGQPGVTETVNQIMAREAQSAAAGRSTQPRETHPRFVPPRGWQHNPQSLLEPNWRAKGGQRGPGPQAPQSLGTNFLGAQISDTIGYIPPDSMGAVGPSQVLVVVNGRIKVFDKSGNLGGLSATTDSFFSTVRSASTSDPHARYDRLTQRWFISMIDVASVNRVLIAVSSGPVITGTSSFTFFQFEHDLVGPTPNPDTGNFADYDTLGVDRYALYIGVNIFNSAGTRFLGTTGFVVNKSNLLSGTLTVTPFRQLATATGSGPYTPQGVANDDPNATEGYFIGVDNQFLGQLDVRRISNPGGTPSISGNLTINVPAYVNPISQVHKGNTLNKNLDALDIRLFAAAIHVDKITGTNTLWTAHNTEVDTNGAAVTGGGRNGSRWYQIGNLNTTPALIQSGTLFDPSVTNTRGFWIPSVAASGQGHMALGCSYAGTNDFAGVATAGRLRTDAFGSIQSPTLAVVSSTAYNISESPNPHRWGDFSQVVLDPNDDMTFWTFQEYCNAANSWGVRAVQLTAAPPATPASAAPASLAQGQTAVNVVITGTSTSGSEFFDPGADTGGPGFSNRIAAAVNGGGVTVNSVTFSNPTNITINVTVAPSATPGARTVTVTNPDGQTMTSVAGILTINGSGTTTANFTGGPTNGVAPLTVTFTNLSTGATNYSWVFGDGNLSSSTNSSNTYTNAGTYSVTLTAIGPGGTNVLTRTNYIVVVAPVVAGFTAGPTNGLAPLTVTFTNLSSGATNYSWAFGDGNLSSNANPTNTYSSAGTYSVTLTAVGPGGTNTFTRTNYIAVVAPVVAGFTGNPTNGVAPLAVSFTNLSIGATNYSWAFGDGHVSSNTNTSNTYSNAGTYSVMLTAVGPGGTNTFTRTNYIVVAAPVVAVFAGSPTNGVAPLTVTFTNLSSGATNYSWAFGDGHLSSNTNASNTYSNAGTYSVTLTAVGPGGTNVLTRTNYVVVVAPVVAGFTGSPTNGVAPLAVTFTNLSSGASNYSWAFGDGHLSSNTNASNTYTNPGTYSVTLTAVGPGGTNTFTRTNYIVVVAPVVAGFAGGPTNGLAPLTVAFTNLTSGATNYSWAFGDGNVSSNTNASNTYTNAGTYSVTLTAVGPGGTNTFTRTNYIVVVAPVVAGFTAGPTNGVAPLAVAFTNLSSGATNYSWAFGDGHLSSNTNASNTYTNAGTYSVTLTAVGPGGTNTFTRTNYIVVVAPVVAGFTGGPTSGVAPLTVTFTNLSSGATNYSWAFGDGNLSTNANPTNTYFGAGTYSVTLTAVGPGGTNVLTRTNYVVVVAPVVADFTASPTNGLAPLTVTFANLSSGATNYSWVFGDGNLSSNPNPTNTYSSPGTYSVTLTAVGAGGTNVLTRTNYVVVGAPVVADFVAGPTNGLAPLTVTFTNLSSGATNYSWAFGDGNLSTNTNPVNTYSNIGTYSVTLTALGANGTNMLTRNNYIVVVGPVVADFTAGPTSGLAPLTVTFTNLSSGATNYSWAFGDGNLSTNTNPVNTYSNIGTYSVTLTALGADGTNILTRTNYIVVVPPVVADFSAGPTNGLAPLTVTFTNLSSGATHYSWAFGDGNLSTNANPANTYSNAGTYSVTLTANGAGGTNTLTLTNYIVVVARVAADFTGGPTNGLAPLTVTFTNLSSGATNYAWAFGDGNLSTDANPTNTYSNAGTYSVTLTAVGAGGTNVFTRTNYIVVVAPVVADFTGSPTNGVAPLAVTFTNLSGGASGFTWDFGDGNLSTNANPANTYSNAGTYSVTLTAVGAGGTNALTRTNYIVVVAPVVADFTGSPTNGVAPLAVTFTNLSSGASEFTWDFGDGNSSTNANPANTYSNAGTYSVTLTAVGSGGTNVLTRTNYIIAVTPVVANFTGTPTNGLAPLTVTFTNLSSGATNYSWAFGDGNLSTNANPVNTYSNSGTYTVTLTSVGPGGTSTLARTNYIVVTLPADLLLVNPLVSPNRTFQFAVSNADGTPISAAQQSNIEIHASANLSSPFTNWSVLTNATLLTNGVLQVTDPSSPLSAQRFYRAVQKP